MSDFTWIEFEKEDLPQSCSECMFNSYSEMICTLTKAPLFEEYYYKMRDDDCPIHVKRKDK